MFFPLFKINIGFLRVLRSTSIWYQSFRSTSIWYQSQQRARICLVLELDGVEFFVLQENDGGPETYPGFTFYLIFIFFNFFFRILKFFFLECWYFSYSRYSTYSLYSHVIPMLFQLYSKLFLSPSTSRKITEAIFSDFFCPTGPRSAVPDPRHRRPPAGAPPIRRPAAVRRRRRAAVPPRHRRPPAGAPPGRPAAARWAECRRSRCPCCTTVKGASARFSEQPNEVSARFSKRWKKSCFARFLE